MAGSTSCGVHMAFTWVSYARRNVEKFYWFGGARRATSQKKSAVSLSGMFLDLPEFKSSQVKR